MQRKTKSITKNPQSAFTIVELLIVIVIIGILAAIVIIFYIGTHDKAIDGALQSDLKGASTVLELDKANGDLYPTTKENANDGKGLKSSNGTTLDYAYSSNNSYCLTASKEGRSYYINSEGRVPVRGECPVESVASSYAIAWGGSGADNGNSMTKTSDNGYAVVGQINYNDLLLSKFTAEGNLQWNKVLVEGTNSWGNSIIQTNDGGYAITGVAEGFGIGGQYDYDVLISKYTADGELSWIKTWGGAGLDFGYSIVQASDNGYVVAGHTGSYSVGGDDVLLAKFTSSGDLSWSKTWGGVGSDVAHSLIKTNDDCFMVTGSTSNYGAGGSDSYGNSYSDVFLVKFSSDGNLLWNKTWGGIGNESGSSIIQATNGDYIVTGSTDAYGAGGTNAYGWANSDALLLKYTANGDLLWSKTWGGVAGNEWFRSSIQTNDGNYVAIGETNSYGSGNVDVALLKYDGNGNIVWGKTFGGSNVELGNSLFQSGNNIIVMGNTISFGSGGYDMLFAKYKLDGSLADCPASICRDSTAGIVTSPSGNSSSPSVSVNSPSASISSPSVSFTSPSFTSTAIATELTEKFIKQELYVAYPGEGQSVCKEWTVPGGKLIKGFKVSQATETNYDFFTVTLDGAERYKKSGIITDQLVDTAGAPGVTIKACMSADGSVQDGYGGEVTGVIYN